MTEPHQASSSRRSARLWTIAEKAISGSASRWRMRSLSGSRTEVGEASAVIRDREDPAFKVIQIPRKRHQGSYDLCPMAYRRRPGKDAGHANSPTRITRSGG